MRRVRLHSRPLAAWAPALGVRVAPAPIGVASTPIPALASGAWRQALRAPALGGRPPPELPALGPAIPPECLGALVSRPEVPCAVRPAPYARYLVQRPAAPVLERAGAVAAHHVCPLTCHGCPRPL